MILSERVRTGVVLALVAAANVAILMALPWWVLLVYLAGVWAWILFTHDGQQSWSITRVGLATVTKRLGSSSVVVVGIAGVVGVLVGILAMGAGFEQTLKQTGSNDTVIVLSAGAPTEGTSTVDGDTLSLVSQLPQIRKDRDGAPIVSAEEITTAVLPKKSSGLDADVGLRGVGQQVWTLWPGIKIIAGRKFKPGLAELVVGKDAHEQFRGLDVGSTIRLEGQSWNVVGIFNSGDAHNSEIWGATDVVGSAYRRENGFNSLTVQLTSALALKAFKAGLSSDPRIKVDAETTRRFYSRQSEGVAQMIGIIGVTIGTIMAIGAVFGALNAMYSAIASRVREIATLRAIGFRTLPVIISVLLEAMLLATLGGAIGGVAAWAIFDGFIGTTLSATGQLAFAFAVSPLLVANGLKWALVIGLIGGLFPAIRAARMVVAISLREL